VAVKLWNITVGYSSGTQQLDTAVGTAQHHQMTLPSLPAERDEVAAATTAATAFLASGGSRTPRITLTTTTPQDE